MPVHTPPTPKAARQWYRFAAAADGLSADLYIYGDIGQSYWDDTCVSAKQFMADLAALPASVTALAVHVNSLGGDVFEAVGIANALRTWGAVMGRTLTTTVDGIAASAASIVIMAGTIIQIADNALVMVHNPWGIVMGNAAEMRKTADALDVVRSTIVTTYQWHSSLDAAALIGLMDGETWMDADTAIANGFATEKVAGLKVAARLDPRAAAKLTIPAPFQDRVAAFLAGIRAAGTDPDPVETPDVTVTEAIGELQQVLPLLAGGSLPELRQALGLLTEVDDEMDDATEAVLQLIDTQEPGAAAAARAQLGRPAPAGPAAAALDVMRQCREAGVLDLAEGLVTAAATPAIVLAAIAEAKTIRAAAAVRASEIAALCATAKLPELAEGYIAGAMTTTAIKAHLTTLTAKLDAIEIDGGLDPSHGTRPTARIDVVAIYAERNRVTS